jgi:hypothetical protein
MNFDLRLPIGVMFTLFGAMLLVFGLVSDAQLYERSLGINVNLVWGLVLLAFGAFMLLLTWRAAKGAAAEKKKGDDDYEKPLP